MMSDQTQTTDAPVTQTEQSTITPEQYQALQDEVEKLRKHSETLLAEKKAEQQKQVIQELEAELKDLKSGVTAAEERARYEMGMMKPNERFVQIVTPSASPANPAESPGQTPPASNR